MADELERLLDKVGGEPLPEGFDEAPAEEHLVVVGNVLRIQGSVGIMLVHGTEIGRVEGDSPEQIERAVRDAGFNPDIIEQADE